MVGALVADGDRPGTARHRLRRAAALPDVPHQDARHRDRRRQRQAVADVLPAARSRGADRRPALRHQRRAQRQPRGAGRRAAGGVSDQDLRGVGGDPAAGGRADGRGQHAGRGDRASAGGGARRDRREHAPGRGHGQDDRAAGADVGDARVGAIAGAAARTSTRKQVLRERLALGDDGDRSAASGPGDQSGIGIRSSDCVLEFQIPDCEFTTSGGCVGLLNESCRDRDRSEQRHRPGDERSCSRAKAPRSSARRARTRW